MSEKRFTFTEFISPYDGRVVSYSIKDNNKRLKVEEVVDSLNKLDSVNKLLKSKNENLKEMFEQSEERAEHWKSLYETLYEKVEG